MMCSGQKGRGSCNGDSGGALVASVDGHMTIVGIVSFGLAAGCEQAPAVYTRVTRFLDYIESAQ